MSQFKMTTEVQEISKYPASNSTDLSRANSSFFVLLKTDFLNWTHWCVKYLVHGQVTRTIWNIVYLQFMSILA